MSQGLDSSGFSADVDFGERLGQALCDRPGLDVQEMLNLASDLMGERDSLLPALRVLATQPSLMALLRAAGTPEARPQFDAVLAFARQTLAPAMVVRLEQVLAAASRLPLSAGHAPPLPVSLQASPDPIASGLSTGSGTVMACGNSPLAAEPGTVMASELRPVATPAPSMSAVSPTSSSASVSGVVSSLQSVVKPLLLGVVLLFGCYGLLRSPWMCKSFDLCSTSDEAKTDEDQLEVKPSAKPVDRPKSKPPAAPALPAKRPVTATPPRTNKPLPDQRPVTRRPQPLPAPFPEESPEPLW